eukprot:9171022-Pyramimonas_sp.AAC.1
MEEEEGEGEEAALDGTVPPSRSVRPRVRFDLDSPPSLDETVVRLTQDGVLSQEVEPPAKRPCTLGPKAPPSPAGPGGGGPLELSDH